MEHNTIVRRPLWLIVSLWTLLGCEEDALFTQPDPPDMGIVEDAALPAPDATIVDMGTPDMGTPVPPAPERVYIHTGDVLYSYDPDSNATTVIGSFRSDDGVPAGMVDIAIDLEGRMYGGTIDQEIYLIDPETAFCRFLFQFDDILHGLTFLADGRLVVAGARVSIIDPFTGELFTEIGQAQLYETSGDIVGLPDGNLYWTVRSDGGMGDGVVRINPRSGNLTWLSEANVDRIFGLGYANGELFGFSSGGMVVVIDPRDGSVIQERTLEGRWWGATTNPVLWND